MKKLWIILALALVLAGCKKEPDNTAAKATPTLDIGGTVVSQDAEILDLSVAEYDMTTVLSVAPKLTNVKTVELGNTDLPINQLDGLREAFPAAKLSYTVSFMGTEIPSDTTSLDMTAMAVENSDELADVAAKLPNLETIDFVNDQGRCIYDLNTIHYLDIVRASVPDVKLEVNFQLFGKKVSSEDEQIKYADVPIGNDGVPQIRAVLPYLQSCNYFLLDGCGIDNELLATMRSDFPETKIVWRVWICAPEFRHTGYKNSHSFLTDTELIRTVKVRDFSSHDLMYCNETKYVDFGHNPFISDFFFLSYMPDLEVAIIALTSVSDLTPLASCPKLEYLEIFTSEVTDLSPLANCTELKHLNVSNLKIRDLSPLFGLTKLERLRVVSCPWITKAQLAEIAEKLPNCDVMTKGYDPTENGWRTDQNGNLAPRYALLRKQMRYDY